MFLLDLAGTITNFRISRFLPTFHGFKIYFLFFSYFLYFIFIFSPEKSILIANKSRTRTFNDNAGIPGAIAQTSLMLNRFHVELHSLYFGVFGLAKVSLKNPSENPKSLHTKPPGFTLHDSMPTFWKSFTKPPAI